MPSSEATSMVSTRTAQSQSRAFGLAFGALLVLLVIPAVFGGFWWYADRALQAEDLHWSIAGLLLGAFLGSLVLGLAAAVVATSAIRRGEWGLRLALTWSMIAIVLGFHALAVFV